MRIDVTFSASGGGGTLVRVEATIPDGGRAEGGLAYLRVVPDWLPAWIAKRDHAPHQPKTLGRLALIVRYAKPATAARWLVDAFGLDCVGSIPESDDGGPLTWIEFHVGDCSLVVLPLDEPLPEQPSHTHEPMVFVDDVHADHDWAVVAGATIVQPVHTHGYTAYLAEDPEGHRWTFAQAGPTWRSP